MENQTETEIDLGRLTVMLLRKWPLILIITAAATLGAFIYATCFITPVYSSNVKFYVNNQQGVSDSIKVQSTDVATSSTLVHGYVALMKTDLVLEEVALNTSLGYTAAQLGAMIDASGVENTPILVVTVRCGDPGDAQTIANAVADISPSVIQEIVKGSSVEIIDRAKLPSAPVYPNVQKMTLNGLLIGFVLSILIALIVIKLDKRVRSGEELTEKFAVPVIGAIPKVSAKDSLPEKQKGAGL